MDRIQRIAGQDLVRAALNHFDDNLEQTIEEAIAFQQIPAPTFSEVQRAEYLAKCFRELALDEISIDKANNVYGRIKGNGDDPPVIVSAHIDTVFSSEVDLTVSDTRGKEGETGFIYGPGLADNATGVAGLLALARACKRFKFPVTSDIWLVGNAAEEGLGDLLGMRVVVERFGKAKAYIVVEGGSFGVIYNKGIGVRRYKLTVETGGGHSWGDFGQPSAVHLMGHIISAIDRLSVSSEPKTSYNVGVVKGGTTVNTIASSAECLLDIRSTGYDELIQLSTSIEAIAERIGQEDGIDVSMDIIGQRPMGAISTMEPVVLWAVEALKEVGCSEPTLVAGSTDANIPISKGYPSVCIGLAKSGNTHRVDEFLDPAQLAAGLGQLLLLTLAAAGYKGLG